MNPSETIGAAKVSAGVSTASSTTTSSTTATISVQVKKEPDDDMKEFTETTMNELLGWYGYEPSGDDADEDDVDDRCRKRTRSHEDSSGPEYSDSGGGGSGGVNTTLQCGWCARAMTDGSQTTGAFCSELCFAQSRRASFKRNRTCDWCQHVRHTVAHVDVKDGARHLQFCGDKCLNQYKMQIFCRETRAHLQAHAQVMAHTNMDAGQLITPELWLKDCKDNERKIDSVPIVTKGTKRKHRPAGRSLRSNVSSTTTASTNRSRNNEVLPPLAMELPQDLRVRARSPPTLSTTPAPAPIPTPSPSRGENINSTNPKIWPPTQPPITVLVPYPVMIPIPVPLPLPLPIPIPLSEEIYQRTVVRNSSATTNLSKTNLTTKTEINHVPDRTFRSAGNTGSDSSGSGSGTSSGTEHLPKRSVPA